MNISDEVSFKLDGESFTGFIDKAYQNSYMVTFKADNPEIVDWNSSQYHSVLEATNYKQAAKALYKDGYATDPNYPEKLITLIKRYRLDRYDQSY